MSSPGPPGGSSGGGGPKKSKVKKKVSKKKKDDEEKVRKDGSATDETASNSDRRDDGTAAAAAAPERKPQSAGASMRDAAQRILTLALKTEWTAAEGVIKSLEKAVEKAKAAAEEEIYIAPLAGVLDPVSSIHFFTFHYVIGFFFRQLISKKEEKKKCNLNFTVKKK